MRRVVPTPVFWPGESHGQGSPGSRRGHAWGRETHQQARGGPETCDPTDGSPPGSPVPGILQARTLRFGLRPQGPCTARRSNQSILKEISPGISLEGMMRKLKLQLPFSFPHRGASPKTWSGWESAPGCCPQAGLTSRATGLPWSSPPA